MKTSGSLHCGLFRSFVVARRAAWLAIEEPIIAEAHVDHRLAENTVFFAEAVGFCLLALHATIFGMTGPGAHKAMLPL